MKFYKRINYLLLVFITAVFLPKTASGKNIQNNKLISITYNSNEAKKQ